MSVLQTIQILPEGAALSKPLFGKLRYQSLYLTTSLTTLLLLQACSGGSGSRIDGRRQDVDNNNEDRYDDGYDDGYQDGYQDGSSSPSSGDGSGDGSG